MLFQAPYTPISLFYQGPLEYMQIILNISFYVLVVKKKQNTRVRIMNKCTITCSLRHRHAEVIAKWVSCTFSIQDFALSLRIFHLLAWCITL